MAVVDELRALGVLGGDGDAFWRSGHFAYESGDHGDVWLALELLSADPARLRRAARLLAASLRPYRPDLVCGPLVGGALLGPWLADELGTGFAYAAPEVADGGPGGGRGYAIAPALRPAVAGARVLVVDDAINAGAATVATVEEVERRGGGVVAVAAILVRVPGTLGIWAGRGIGLERLVDAGWRTWPAADCPLCRGGVALDRVG